MTNVEKGQDDLNNIHFGKLKALAKSYGVKAQRDWQRADYLTAIQEKQGAGVAPDLSTLDESSEADQLIADYSLPVNRTTAAAATGAPKPGYARIILHKDPTPQHANSHVQVGLNGKYYSVPRGVAVDIPIPYLGVLRDAVHKVRRQIKEPDSSNLDGVFTEEDILSYPYQIVSLTPGGKFVNLEDQRSNSANRRAAFHKAIGRWPTDGELIEWEKAKIASKG